MEATQCDGLPDMIGRYQVLSLWHNEPLGRIVVACVGGEDALYFIRELRPPATLPAAERGRLVRALELEYRALAHGEDPRIPAPHEVGVVDGSGFLVYRSPAPDGFQPVPTDPGLYPAAQWLRIGPEVCAALAALVRAGVPPQPFRPSYVFASPGGEVRYLPLGLGHLARAAALPEAFLPSDARALSALDGAVGESGADALCRQVAVWLYLVLSGDTPRPALELMNGSTQPQPLWERNPAVPAAADLVLRRALSRNPAERYNSLDALGQALAGAGHAATPAAPANPAEEPLALRFAGEFLAATSGAWLLGWIAARFFPWRP
jgi:eukaryotic-like serine/threonine-protein kinase